MSLLTTPLWQNLNGDPITGASPPSLVMLSGRLTPQRHGEIRRIYMHFSMTKLTAVGDYFAFDRVLSDGTRVRIESMQGRDRVFVWADAPSDDEQDMLKGWRALPSNNDQSGWVRHRTTGALLAVGGGDDAITTPGYEGTNPHVYIAAGNGDVKLNSKHAAGYWYWTDHKKQRLLFTENGAYYRQKLVSFHVGGAKDEDVVRGGGIAGGWILLVVKDKLYALKKSAVERSTSSKPVAAIVVGSVPTWKIPRGLVAVWRFSPDGLKAVAVEGLGRVDDPADKHLSRNGPTTTGAQFIHRLELTATDDSAAPFNLSVHEEVRQNSVLKIQPRYQFTTNELEQRKFEFLRWDAYASAVITYALHFESSPKTYHWTRQGDDVYLHQHEYDELVEAVRNVKPALPALGDGLPATSLILHPNPGMRDYVLEPVPFYPERFGTSYIDADGNKAYVSGGSNNSGLGIIASLSGETTSAEVVQNLYETVHYQHAYIQVYLPNSSHHLSDQNAPFARYGHTDFVRRSSNVGPDYVKDAYYDLRVLAPGWTAKFRDTYPLAAPPRPLNDVLQEGKNLVAFYAGQTLPKDLDSINSDNASAEEYVRHLHSPTTLDEALDMEAKASARAPKLRARPSCVFRYTDGGAANLGVYPSGPMYVSASNPDRLEADPTFWQRHYTDVVVNIRLKPYYNLHSVVDCTAATIWAYSGRCIVDIDYGADGSERVLELVADESKAVRYDVSLRAVDVYSGDITPEAQAQRSLSGSCRFTLQLDGEEVAESVLSASDSFSGFLWTEYREDWRNFRSNTWASLWGEGSWGQNSYDTYLGRRRDSDGAGTGQIANTEAAGSMSCQVSCSGFELLDWDVRFGHVLLADTTQQATRATKATADDAERTSGTIGVSLWDNGQKRVLHPPVQAPESRAMWDGAVPMLQRMLYRGAGLTRPATYLSGTMPPAYRLGINGSTPYSKNLQELALEIGLALDPDRPLSAFYDYFRTGLVHLDYEAVLVPPRARGFSKAGNASTLGYVLSYSPEVWLAVVNRDSMHPYDLVLPSFSVVRAETFEQPSDAKRLGELLPYLKGVANTGNLAQPGYVI